MYSTQAFYNSDGVQRDYAVPFSVIKTEYIKVYQQAPDSTGTFTGAMEPVGFIVINAGMIRLGSPVPKGLRVIVRRETYADMPLVDFQDAAILVEEDLDLASLQALHVAQEAKDQNGSNLDAAMEYFQTLQIALEQVVAEGLELQEQFEAFKESIQALANQTAALLQEAEAIKNAAQEAGEAATTAANSAKDAEYWAKQWAEQPPGIPVKDDEYSARHYADKAKAVNGDMADHVNAEDPHPQYVRKDQSGEGLFFEDAWGDVSLLGETTNLVPAGNSETQDLGTALKPWGAGHINKLVAPGPETGLEKEIPVADIATNAAVADAVASEADNREQAVRAEADARNTALQAEAEARGEAIQKLRDAMESLQGIVTYLDSYNFGAATPAQEVLTAYALVQTGWSTVKNATSVVNEYDRHEWIYNTETVRWINYGQSTVTLATNEHAGIVKGSAEDGKVSIGEDGTMSPVGFAPLKSPKFTGSPSSTTPPTDDNSDRVSTTAHVRAAIEAFSGGGEDYPAMPTNDEGVGQWIGLKGVVVTGGYYTLPSGGTWAYLMAGGTNSNNYWYLRYTTSGVAAGGTQVEISAGTNMPTSGFIWRIA